MMSITTRTKLLFAKLDHTRWKIIHGDSTGIIIKNDSGDAIDIDIAIPMACGAIFACHFIRDLNISTTSTDMGARMNVQKANGLLGHSDEESTCETAK